MSRALRLTPPRRRALRRLYNAGERGEAVLMFPIPAQLANAGLAEFYTDPSRVLSERLRLTELGRRVTVTLLLPKE